MAKIINSKITFDLNRSHKQSIILTYWMNFIYSYHHQSLDEIILLSFPKFLFKLGPNLIITWLSDHLNQCEIEIP